MRGNQKDVNRRYVVCEYVAYIVREQCTIRECARFFTRVYKRKVYPGTVYVYASKYFKELYPDHPFNQRLRNIWEYNKKHHQRRGGRDT